MLTTEEIVNYISKKKFIQGKANIKPKNKWSHEQCWFTLFSEDHNDIFDVFMRHSKHLPNCFSIGISIKTESWSIWLFRYNWAHWLHRNRLDKEIIECHIFTNIMKNIYKHD